MRYLQLGGIRLVFWLCQLNLIQQVVVIQQNLILVKLVARLPRLGRNDRDIRFFRSVAAMLSCGLLRNSVI
jgi:hypothetical protein